MGDNVAKILDNRDLSLQVLAVLIVLFLVQAVLFFRQLKGGFELDLFKKRPKKAKKKVALVDYVMVFSLKSGGTSKISFQSEVTDLERNKALQQYFKQVGEQLALTSDVSQFVDLANVVGISLEKSTPVFDLFSLPEVSEQATVNVFDLPEAGNEEPEKEVVVAVSEEPTSVSLSGAEIKAARVELDITQKALGEMTGINPRRISRIEREQVEPTSEEMAEIKRVLKLGLDEKEVVLETPESLSEPPLVAIDEIVVEEPKAEKQIPLAVNKRKFFKKKEKQEKSTTVPKGKKKVATGFRYVAWASIALLGAAGVFGYLNSSNAAATARGVENNVSALQKQLETPEVKEDHTGRIQSYFADFVPTYINTFEDTDKRNERELELKTYFSDSFEVSNPAIDRRLENFKFYELAEENDYQVIRYVVTYSVPVSPEGDSKETNVADQAEEKERATYTQLLSVPFVEVEGLFGIVEYPYFSLAPEQKGLVKMEENKLTGSLSEGEAQEVYEFTNQFFKNYAANSVEDMQYMMNNPESLNGDFEFVSADSEVYPSEDNKFTVVSVVTFKIPETEIQHKERMTLIVSKQKDGKYLVENLKHTGGND